MVLSAPVLDREFASADATDDTEAEALDTAESRWVFAWERRGRLLAHARRRTSNPHVAADALCYALLEAGRAKARAPGALYRWLETCVEREIGRETVPRGSARSRARYANTLLVRETDTARLMDEECESALMLGIVGSLPPHLRRMFTILSEGGTARDVASEFSMTVKAVECLIWRTRRWCRMELAKAIAASPIPLLARWLRGRRFAVALVPLVALLGLALSVVVTPLLPSAPQGRHSASVYAATRTTARPATWAERSPSRTATTSASVPGPTWKPRPPMPQIPSHGRGKQLVPQAVANRLPLGPEWTHGNNSDSERTIPEEVVACVERFVDATPPRSLHCQPER